MGQLDCAHCIFDGGDSQKGYAQFADTQAEQQGHSQRIARDFAAQRHGLARCLGGNTGQVDEMENRRMQWVGKFGDGAVRAVTGKDILGKVVGTNAKEIDMRRE